jgi:hypothetical protein
MKMLLQKLTVKWAGAQWIGMQKADYGSFILFRDPVTGSTLAIAESDLTIFTIRRRMLSSRLQFEMACS